MTHGLPVAISYSGGASSEWLVEALLRGVAGKSREAVYVRYSEVQS
jgi:PP-loop superfamily ATP-utilizing enzyme